MIINDYQCLSWVVLLNGLKSVSLGRLLLSWQPDKPCVGPLVPLWPVHESQVINAAPEMDYLTLGRLVHPWDCYNGSSVPQLPTTFPSPKSSLGSPSRPMSASGAVQGGVRWLAARPATFHPAGGWNTAGPRCRGRYKGRLNILKSHLHFEIRWIFRPFWKKMIMWPLAFGHLNLHLNSLKVRRFFMSRKLPGIH